MKSQRNRRNRIRFPRGDCTIREPCRQSVQNVPIINLPRSQAHMQRTSATCYFAYNDAAVHANARNHPGDDIKRGPVVAAINPLPLPPFLPPEAKSVSRGLSFVP